MISTILLIVASLGFAALNFAGAIRVGHWMIDRFSPEATVVVVLLFCSPTIVLALRWL